MWKSIRPNYQRRRVWRQMPSFAAVVLSVEQLAADIGAQHQTIRDAKRDGTAW